MTPPRGKQLFVWEDGVQPAFSHGYDGVIVKVADGLSTASPGGFSWADNFQAWRKASGYRAIHAWGVPYPGDGARFGSNIAPHLVGASSLTLDVEDFNGAVWDTAAVDALVGGVRAALPHLSIGYSSYPTAQQCADHHIDHAALERLCDFSMPQVYYPYQTAELALIQSEHHHPILLVSPPDAANWLEIADASEKRYGGVGFWRAGVTGWEGWPTHVTTVPDGPPAGGGAADPIRPTVNPATFPARFIAWDGGKWWLTDAIIRRECTESMVQGLVGFGVPVAFWPHCQAETAQLTVG